MLAVRHFPELVQPALWDWLHQFAVYDADGRASRQLPIGPELEEIGRVICPKVTEWESVFLQCYQHGSATTPCHADLNNGLGFILSLGATRTLRLHRVPDWARGCGDYDLDPIRLECVSGTAVIMDEEFHRHHHHQIVPDPGAGERMGLVFRTRGK